MRIADVVDLDRQESTDVVVARVVLHQLRHRTVFADVDSVALLCDIHDPALEALDGPRHVTAVQEVKLTLEGGNAAILQAGRYGT